MNDSAEFGARALCCFLLALGAGSLLAQESVSARPAMPIDPVTAILEAFRSHDIVALDEGAHGNEQGHALRVALIRHPAFVRSVNDIVVEFGNARYQDLMDRFVRGEDVAADLLRHAWQDTTQHAVWDVPIYEEFFRTVRAVNASLPRDRQLRVLLSDPPIDWAQVRTPPDHFKWLRMRDSYSAEVIQREVLAKKRRALLVYGGMHLQRKHISANYEPLEGADTVISILDHAGSARIFTIWTPTTLDLQTLQADVTSWRVPSLAIVRGTQLGRVDFASYVPAETTRFAIRDGKPAPLSRDQWRALHMEEQFDAVLYLGPPSKITIRKLPTTLCSDPTYLKMRRERMIILNQQTEADRFEQECRRQTSK
jgi:hypothetical protein